MVRRRDWDWEWMGGLLVVLLDVFVLLSLGWIPSLYYHLVATSYGIYV